MTIVSGCEARISWHEESAHPCHSERREESAVGLPTRRFLGFFASLRMTCQRAFFMACYNKAAQSTIQTRWNHD